MVGVLPLQVVVSALFDDGPELSALAEVLVDQLVVRSDLIEELIVVGTTRCWIDACEIQTRVPLEFVQDFKEKAAVLGTYLRDAL